MKTIHSNTTHYTYIENENELEGLRKVLSPIHTRKIPCYVKFNPTKKCHLQVNDRFVKYDMENELEKLKRECEELEEKIETEDDRNYLTYLFECWDELENEIKILTA